MVKSSISQNFLNMEFFHNLWVDCYVIISIYFKIGVILWEILNLNLNLNLTYQQKYVLYATALLTGEKNGLIVGMKSNIVLKDVGEISHLRR